jgi:hypothetical protein
VPGFLQKWRLAFRPNNLIFVSSDQRILLLMVWEHLGAIWQTPSRLSCAVYWGVASVWQLYRKAWLVECCKDGCPFGRFFHLHRGTLELCQSDHQVLGHLNDQGPSLWLLSLARRPALGSSKLLPFKHYGCPCVLEDLQCRLFFLPFPRLLLWHALSTVGPYIDRCVPFQIMSNQLNLPQVDSNQVVETSQGWSMETGCIWAQFRVS